MKNLYEEMQIEIIALSTDIVTFSENAKDDVVDDIFGTNN